MVTTLQTPPRAHQQNFIIIGSEMRDIEDHQGDPAAIHGPLVAPGWCDILPGSPGEHWEGSEALEHPRNRG